MWVTPVRLIGVRNTHLLVAVALATSFAAPAALAQTQLLGVEFRDGTFGGKNARLFDVDPITGVASNPRFTGSDVLLGIAQQDDAGPLFALTDDIGQVNGAGAASSLITIDPTTGATAVVGGTGLTLSEGDLDFDPVGGGLLGVSTQNGVVSLFDLDVATGAATGVRTLDVTGDGSGLAFAPDGSLYVLDTTVDGQPTQAFLYEVDPATAAILDTVTLPLGLGNVAGIDFADDGTLFLADGDFNGTDSLYTVDLATGATTTIGETVTTDVFGGLGGLEFATVPEPASLALLGIAGFSLVRRR